MHRDVKRVVAVALKQLRIPETDCVILYESQDRHTLRNENKRPFVAQRRERYNKLIEEGKFRVWEAEDPMCKIQQYLMERK